MKAKRLEVQVYKRTGGSEGGFSGKHPVGEDIIYAAELRPEGDPPKKLFGKSIVILARNIALNLDDGGFELKKSQSAGKDALAFEDSELLALEHAIRFTLRGNGGTRQ